MYLIAVLKVYTILTICGGGIRKSSPTKPRFEFEEWLDRIETTDQFPQDLSDITPILIWSH